MNRRDLLLGAAAASIAATLPADEADAAAGTLPRRALGKTGEKLSIIGLGGIVVMGDDQENANHIVRRAVERGVNYFDVAPSYGDGEAEEKLGPALEPFRKQSFLACKTGRRDKSGAEEELHRSLKRLRTEHFDLYQLHGLTSKEDAEKAFAPGGAMETFVAAKQQGLVRFLGFSAHSVDAALLAMDRYAFDTILFPVNWVCFTQGHFGPQVLKAAHERGMGCLALKALARNPWPEGATHDYPKCWYQPTTDSRESELALRFTLSQPITAALPPGDERLFNVAVSVAQRFKPLTADERKDLVQRAASVTPIFRHAAA